MTEKGKARMGRRKKKRPVEKRRRRADVPAEVKPVATKTVKKKRKGVIVTEKQHFFAPGGGLEGAILQIRTLYVTDPRQRSVEFHMKRKDYRFELDPVSRPIVVKRAQKENWAMARTQYWEEVEARVTYEFLEETVRLRTKDLKQLEEAYGYLSEYLLPVKNKDGSVRVTKEGKPKYAAKMGSFSQILRSALDLHMRTMMLRGTAVPAAQTKAVAHVLGEGVMPPGESVDDEETVETEGYEVQMPKISDEDAAYAARALLERRIKRRAEGE